MEDFSIPFQVDKLGPNPKKIHIEANANDLEGLAERFGLLNMDFFKGHVLLQRLSGKKIEAKFEATAKIKQECVVTFKPLYTEINLSFSRIYDSSVKYQDDEKEVEIDIDATDELDPIIDGVIDLGAAVSEELGLEIDPFPRAGDTDFKDFGVGPEITEEELNSTNPFAVLEGLKKKND